MCECNVLSGKLFVCSFNFDNDNPCSRWLKNEILKYVNSDLFKPLHTLNEDQLSNFINSTATKLAKNTNFAVNENDKASKRKK